MTTINLYQNKENSQRLSAIKTANSGFFFSLGILVLVLITLFGLRFYIPMVESKSVAMYETIEKEKAGLAGMDNFEQIIDMQVRLDTIKANLKIEGGEVKRTEMMQVIDKLSENINKNVVISAFNYDEDSLKIGFTANNFEDASKQIFNFKKVDYFKDVNLSSISRGESGVDFELEMSI